MFSKEMIAVAVALVASVVFCEGAQKYRVESGGIVLDSPFALEIGSTEYSAAFGKWIRTSAYANYDPMARTTTTNFQYYATAHLSKPYFGFNGLSLMFKGREKHLERCSFSSYGPGRVPADKMSYEECREKTGRIVADIQKRLGIVMRCFQDETEDAAKQEVDRHLKKYREANQKCHGVAVSFLCFHGARVGKFGLISYDVNGMVNDKGDCSVCVSCSLSSEPASYKSGDRIPVITNMTYSSYGGMLMTENQRKKAHEEADKLRKTFTRLFGVDFASSSATNGLPCVVRQTNGQDKAVEEWTVMSKPFEGMTESRLYRAEGLHSIPYVSFSLRRAYPGDISEDELKEQAKRVLGRLESEYGESIPKAHTMDESRLFAGRTEEGVPVFGDTRALLCLDKKVYFKGRVGDLSVEICYAEPRYAKRGERFEIICKGAVLVNIVQSSIGVLRNQKK